MKSKWSKRLLSLGAVVLGVLADYFTKLIAVSRLKGEDPVPLIRGILRFSYVENPGAAWGMLANHRWVFMVFSVLAIAAIAAYLIRRDPPILLCVSLSLILSGGIGNMIDRTFRGAVVDFIEFYLFEFPVFNVADCLVVIGSGLLIVWLIVDTVREKKKAKQTGEVDGGEDEK
ncbi:MAG: signal peptidase II [Clostridia bacterium]|nr:signal peptidase II [Clostridia bacterium]